MERPRCQTHALLLDDAGACKRCEEEHDGETSSRWIGYAFGGLFAVTVLAGTISTVRLAMAEQSHEPRHAASGGAIPAAAVASSPTTKDEPVTVFSTASCPHCRRAKTWLDEHKVAYVERRVDLDDAAREELVRVSGSNGVPVFVVDDEVIKGFDARGTVLEQALTRHGRPH